MAGLTHQEVQKRIQAGQINTRPDPHSRSVGDIIRGNLLTYFNFINLLLFLLVLTTGQLKNGVFILTAVNNVLIGIIQELRAKQVLDSLSLLVVEDIDTLRDGTWQKVKADQLVKDDRIRLKNGQQIPADAQLISGYLEVNESALTGEANQIIKNPGSILLAGSDITAGDGEADVIRVGKDNFSETIMKDARRFSIAKSELRDDMEHLLHLISIVIVPVGILLYITQKNLIGMRWDDAIIKTVSGIVGMIPEGLMVLISVALAVSVIRLSRQQVLVQDLYSIEQLARVDVVCMDKTGTLTEGRMKVEEVIPLLDTDPAHFQDLMGSYVRVFQEGNATDRALQEYFARNDHYQETDVLPFSSERKYSAVSFGEEGTFYFGAPNILFPAGHPAFSGLLRRYSEEGRRVLVMAHLPDEKTGGDLQNLEPLALIIIEDVIRENAPQIMQYFRQQGVTLKVISGDDARTVSTLAQRAGIANAQSYADMSQARYRDPASLVNSCAVFGRVRPEQKKALVQALQQEGHTVAMIGDGVNDVPALKAADVGIAMAAGSSAAKDSANIVLLTSDFGMLPDIIQEGRRVINNIGRSASMYLVKTMFSMLLSLYVIIFRKDYPFLPVHMSVLSALCVGVPTFLLQFEASFERIQPKFLLQSFRRALPSSLAVMVTVLYCDLLQSLLHFSDGHYYLILLSLTSYIYIYTLYRVYYPPTKGRKAVLIGVCIAIVGAFLLLHQMMELSFAFLDLVLMVPGLFLLPLLVASLHKGIEWIHAFIKKRYVSLSDFAARLPFHRPAANSANSRKKIWTRKENRL